MPQQIGNPQPGSHRCVIGTGNVRAEARGMAARLAGGSPDAAVNRSMMSGERSSYNNKKARTTN